jgi:mannose/fructose/N-acetylgalactosamine-specific phosphotransferase system component IIC
MSAEPFVAAGLGALLALDHAACVSLLLSQPIVAAALFGAALGHFESSVAAGTLVQLVWMVTHPVGGARLPEAWLGGAAAAAAAPAALPPDWLAAATATPAAVVGVAAALAAAPLVRVQRRWQSARAAAVVERARGGDFAAVARAQAAALALHAGRGAVLAVAALFAAPRLAAALSPAMAGVAAAWVALALAVVGLGRSTAGRRLPLWMAGAVVGGLYAWFGGRT